MNVRRITIAALLLGVTIGSAGCAQIMGSLRRDLNDQDDPYADAPPTTGGTWAEHGFLGDDLPAGGGGGGSVGHTERGPASAGYARSSGPNSWVTSEDEAANQRDNQRGMGADDGVPDADTDPTFDPAVRRQYKNGSRATRADFVDESQNEGSLWAGDGQTNYYFSKNKVRGVGDIVTVNVEAGMVRDVGVEVRRTLTPRERDYEMAIAQERIRAKAQGTPGPDPVDPKDQVASSAAAPARSPAGAAGTGQQASAANPDADVPLVTPADVDVSKSLGIKAGDSLMGEILERYPNGNYKIRATKKISYRGGAPRMITVVGVVKGSDISEDDVVPSGKLYEYRIQAAR